MFGFNIVIDGIKSDSDKNCLVFNNIKCENHMIDKFGGDKLFFDVDKYIIILDGVILNKKKWEGKYNSLDWSEIVVKLYELRGDEFFSLFRGSFSGALYDKLKDKWIIFGDQFGSKFLYYTKKGNFFCCSSIMGEIYRILKENNKEYNLSVDNSLLLLTYGFMIDDRTLCSDIKKINPGCYLILDKGELKEKRYYLLKNESLYKNLQLDDAIEIVDELFRQAVRRQFEKDIEAGYEKHLVALSGGLDCRMTSFVAHEMGYVSQLNMTFSQSDYWDEVIPKHMARDMKHEWIFKSLDAGVWLKDVDDITNITGGNVLYYGLAHGNSLMKYLNFDRCGLLHSGQIGDVVIGSFIKSHEKNILYHLGEGAYSKKYIEQIEHIKPQLSLDKEIGLFYYRAFNGTNNGLQNLYNYTETLSPFLDLDFIEGMLSIPLCLRENHKLYKSWIIKKYPKAANYVWEKTGCKITAREIVLGNKNIPLVSLPHKVINRLRNRFGKPTNKNMNPIAYYLNENYELRDYLNSYFDYVEKIKDNNLKAIVLDIKNNGSAIEKIQVITLLSALKIYY